MVHFRQLGHEHGGHDRILPRHVEQQPSPGLPDRAVLLSTILTISFARWQPQGVYLGVWLPLPTSLTVHPVSSSLARLGCARKVCVPGAAARWEVLLLGTSPVNKLSLGLPVQNCKE